MFKRLLAGVGIGAAKVDLEIQQTRVELGGIIYGMAAVSSGSVDQQVEEIYISLVLTSSYKHDDETKHIQREIGRVKVADGLLLKAGAPETSIPVQLQIPYNIPISRGRTQYYLSTGLDIKNAVDPKDADEITITPNTYVKMIFDGLRLLGFRDKPTSGDYDGRYQKFEYKPTKFMAGKLDEIEMYITVGEKAVDVLMQIDKKARGILGKLIDDLDLDERYVKFTMPYAKMHNEEQVAVMLKEVIESEYAKINI